MYTCNTSLWTSIPIKDSYENNHKVLTWKIKIPNTHLRKTSYIPSLFLISRWDFVRFKSALNFLLFDSAAFVSPSLRLQHTIWFIIIVYTLIHCNDFYAQLLFIFIVNWGSLHEKELLVSYPFSCLFSNKICLNYTHIWYRKVLTPIANRFLYLFSMDLLPLHHFSCNTTKSGNQSKGCMIK